MKLPSHLTLVRLAQERDVSIDALLGVESTQEVDKRSRELPYIVARLSEAQRVAVMAMLRELVSPAYRARRRASPWRAAPARQG